MRSTTKARLSSAILGLSLGVLATIGVMTVSGATSPPVELVDIERPVYVEAMDWHTAYVNGYFHGHDDARNDVAAPEWFNLPPCQLEDEAGCYWDATHHGNGAGDNFYTLNN